MPDIHDLLSDAEQRRERAVAGLTPREGATSATVTRIRRRRTLRRGAQLAVVVPVVAALGWGAVTLAGRSATPPAETPTTTAAPSPEDSPSPTPTPTGPTVTDAVQASFDVEREWFRMGGQVPVDAPIATFPVSTAPADPEAFGCTDEQVDWLVAHGTANDEGIRTEAVEPPVTAGAGPFLPVRTYSLTSDAAGAVTLRNLRVEGAAAEVVPARLRFGCVNGGIGGTGYPYFVVADASTAAPATYAEDPGVTEDWYFSPEVLLPADKVGTPFAMDLPAAMTYLLNLIPAGVDPTRDFRGQVVADAVIDGVTFQTVIDGDLELLAPATVTNVYAVAGYGRLFCLPDEGAYHAAISGYSESFGPMSDTDLAQYECTPQELAEAVGGGS